MSAAASTRATAWSQLAYELETPENYWDDEKAVCLLVEYFTRRRSRSDLIFSGAHFERGPAWGGPPLLGRVG
ncbi:hypothetical protein GCM10009680_42970 [Streptomyces yatensis]|uniref:Uncharacterized protein n=1 Tax=Streptomyces yatensis TaxID=155177 RepID=A0ABN2I3V4_9ACTN